ncbi:benzoate 1,2-dioxygenase electron transfer component BenC [Rufibacter glacialis]|uniref:2Fe-2S iron-sulfur cluster binding domain-containing protein n=1 Tax=Rufibacter glacialis TaxID=1259555 RepID=A0A5M8QKV8_9BACT|nr:benzoate 1,2-dioxygenase electron transfer component BenC [Rufibacter glacialis]KAA6435396.1 2Fe-2S iron-sulfur cluster binding domain-containing protein [Rufibacter glacialis]GGK63059.1 toluate 1,2-dioxygenase electron transfer subunit [Rufibacter glacialis]
MPTIALNFEDGVTKIIGSLSGETIAEAAYRQGVNIPLDCADGACGTCKCRWKSGQYDPGDYIEDALSDEEAAQGYGLACQMRPETDVVVDILASSAACKVEVRALAATISALELVSSEIVKLRLKTDQNLPFLPGQYANLEIPGLETSRSYSFSNLSNTAELEFLVRLVPNGLMSTFLKNQAQVGDALTLAGPMGSFYTRDITRPTLFFAGGTGIAPFLAMLEKLATEEASHPIRLYYGATTEENLVELERLNAFKAVLPLEIYCCVSGAASVNYPEGFVTQWVNKEHLTEDRYDIYICGPTAMVEAVQHALTQEEIQVEHFYTEKFLPTGTV